MADDDRNPNGDGRSASGPATPAGEPRRSWLSRIIGQGPAARRRLGEAVAALLGTALVAVAAIGALVIWHLIRRGRLIRERQAPPRIVRMPELPDVKGELHEDDDAVATA
jgi:hypothetical protein